MYTYSGAEGHEEEEEQQGEAGDGCHDPGSDEHDRQLRAGSAQQSQALPFRDPLALLIRVKKACLRAGELL